MEFSRDASSSSAIELAAGPVSSTSSSSPATGHPLQLRATPRSCDRISPTAASLDDHGLLRCCDCSTDVPASTEVAADDGFERIRARLLDHLRQAVGRIELPTIISEVRWKPLIQDDGGGGDERDAHCSDFKSTSAAAVDKPCASTAPPVVCEELPWNLRKWKPAADCNARQHRQNPKPALAASSPAKTTSRLRSGALQRRWLPKFSVSLTKEQVDEDLYAFTGRRASRRPRKRPRAVQSYLDALFPGLRLSRVTLDGYRVAELPPVPSRCGRGPVDEAGHPLRRRKTRGTSLHPKA